MLVSHHPGTADVALQQLHRRAQRTHVLPFIPSAPIWRSNVPYLYVCLCGRRLDDVLDDKKLGAR